MLVVIAMGKKKAIEPQVLYEVLVKLIALGILVVVLVIVNFDPVYQMIEQLLSLLSNILLIRTLVLVTLALLTIFFICFGVAAYRRIRIRS